MVAPYASQGPAMTAAEARAWVAENDFTEIVEAVVATAPPLPAGVADIWWRAAFDRPAIAPTAGGRR